MNNPYFITFELVAYSLSLLCFIHAFKKGAGYVMRLGAGIAFGLLLELAAIHQLNAYAYGEFPTMILDVPLCIGVSWGSILYSVMEFSNASSLPWLARPILDGLLALNIDLATDTIAIRLGMWDWGQTMDFQYFGVPYANFWAWFWVISSFSFGYRLLEQKGGRLKTWLAPAVALTTGLVWVLATNAFIAFLVPPGLRNLVVALVIFGTLGKILALHPRFYQKPAPALVYWVPFGLHMYFIIAGAVSGVIFDPPFLLIVSLLMLGIASYLHRPSIRSMLKKYE
jgi:hypothetical protein